MKRARKIAWLSLIVVTSFVFGTASLAQANLLVNSGF